MSPLKITFHRTDQFPILKLQFQYFLCFVCVCMRVYLVTLDVTDAETQKTKSNSSNFFLKIPTRQTTFHASFWKYFFSLRLSLYLLVSLSISLTYSLSLSFHLLQREQQWIREQFRVGYGRIREQLQRQRLQSSLPHKHTRGSNEEVCVCLCVF